MSAAVDSLTFLAPEALAAIEEHLAAELRPRLLSELRAELAAEHESPWLTARQAAEHLRISESHFKKIAPTLPRHSVPSSEAGAAVIDGNHRWRYHRDELDEFLRGRQ